MRVEGKSVVVTGAGSGMGRALAAELTRRGAKVIAVDINATSLAETEALVPGCRTFAIDITDRAAVEALPQRIGTVDALINCAGIIQPFVPLNELDFQAIDRVFDVNFRGTLYMTKTFLPLLLERPEAHVVNVSSMGGFLPVPGQTMYGASKAAVKLMTEGLHSELSGTRVRVSVAFPGAVATNIVANSGITRDIGGGKTRKILSADAAARIMVDGMERDAFRIIVGKDAWFLDLFYRLSPKRATGFIAKMMKDLSS